MGNGAPPLNNGWAEYQRLVLAELERHNKLIEVIDTKLSEIQLALALMKERNGQTDQEIKERNRKVDKQLEAIGNNHSNLDARVKNLETSSDIESAIQRYKKWIFGTMVLLLGSIIIPLVKILFFS